MKNSVAVIAFLMLTQFAFGQWSEEEIKPFIQQTNREVEKSMAKLMESKKWDTKNDALIIEFTKDTMKIETIARLLFNEYYSTFDMLNTITYQIDEYDKLLNKYYKLLMGKLSEEKKVKFRNAQRVWLKYRDSEIGDALNAVTPEEGTMWRLSANDRILDIVKERVCTIYDFLTWNSF